MTGTISNDTLGDVAAHAAAASGWSQQFPQSPAGDLTSVEAKAKRAELRARLGKRARSVPSEVTGVDSPGAAGQAPSSPDATRRPPRGIPVARAVCTCGASDFGSWDEALHHAAEDGHDLCLSDAGDGAPARTPTGVVRTS